MKYTILKIKTTPNPFTGQFHQPLFNRTNTALKTDREIIAHRLTRNNVLNKIKDLDRGGVNFLMDRHTRKIDALDVCEKYSMSLYGRCDLRYIIERTE